MQPGTDDDRPNGRYDMGSSGDQRRIRSLADEYLASGATSEELIERGRQPGTPIDVALALRLARSKRYIREIRWDGELAVVMAMWGERRRLRPRGPENPTGEDSLHAKLDQLEWLFRDSAVRWSLLPVDDGDPEDSASVARERAADHPLGDRVRVLRLADALPATNGPLATLADVDQSRKGGAIVLGAATALERGADAILITDADNSVHLGQAGLLLEPFVRRGSDVVVGDRKHPDAVLVKAEARWGPGIVVLRHMQRMVGRALFGRGLRDTQAAFKLYGRRALEPVLAAPSTFGFSFDSDWLLAALGAGAEIERIPFVFTDSFEESASIVQGPMTTWESLLQGLVAAARARGADHDEEMATVVDDFGQAATLEKVVARVPEALVGVSDAELGQRSTMTPSELRTWLETL